MGSTEEERETLRTYVGLVLDRLSREEIQKSEAFADIMKPLDAWSDDMPGEFVPLMQAMMGVWHRNS